jgi:hypothetical protein
MSSPSSIQFRADEYCRRSGIARVGRLGEGKDGAV